MNYYIFAFLFFAFSLNALVEESILPSIETTYNQDFGRKYNHLQKLQMKQALARAGQKIRVMTFNMLYNAKEAEDKLPLKHQWPTRKPRLIEYLLASNADIIGSQELQEDQVKEVMEILGTKYNFCGDKTRTGEGRTDFNAVFYNKERFELIDSKTIPYNDEPGQNAFTVCTFNDKVQNKKFVVMNTKLNWKDADKRLEEAVELNKYSLQFIKEPLLVLGDFNVVPNRLHKKNIFLDGEYVEKILQGQNLKDSKYLSIFGHFGPITSITNSANTLEPFAGPELSGFILDHIFVNDQVEVLSHAIDVAKVNGEYPSDHFPVVAEILFK